MEKSELRNELFKKYFEETEGPLLTDFVDNLSFIPKTWRSLHKICEQNIDYFNTFTSLDHMNLMIENNKQYLVLNFSTWNFIIIDLETNKTITKEEYKKKFDDEVFMNTFYSKEEQPSFINIIEYNGNPKELLDFYIENKEILTLPTTINYGYEKDSAWTNLNIDFVNEKISLSFQTEDQFLYEHLFLNYDLTPMDFQDATKKIGKERLEEMFNEIKKIIVPKDIIPNVLYKKYLNQRKANFVKIKKINENETKSGMIVL